MGIGKRLTHKSHRKDVTEHFPEPSMRKAIAVEVSLIFTYSPHGWQQERAPENGSRVRLRDGLHAPRPRDLCYARTECSVAPGSLFFIGLGKAGFMTG